MKRTGPFVKVIIGSRRGIALLTVLWVLAILMVIVFSFSFATRTEIQATLSFKEGLEKKFLAEAGMERAILELFYRKQNLSLEGSDPWKTDGTAYSGQLGEGSYTVKVFDESGKVDINSHPEVILRNLVANLGLEEETVNTIVDSILDWKDADDFHRLQGAESDYYQSLPNPYKAKNAPFETVEELLLVKGVTPRILYGGDKKKGLIHFITVQGKSNKVNLNAAPREVLLAVPGMTVAMAEGILIYRQEQEIKNIQEIMGILGDQQALILPFVTVASSTTFTIESMGFTKSKQAGYGLRATISLTGDNKSPCLYFKSPALLMEKDGSSE